MESLIKNYEIYAENILDPEQVGEVLALQLERLSQLALYLQIASARSV
jgi:hypothetical protein